MPIKKQPIKRVPTKAAASKPGPPLAQRAKGSSSRPVYQQAKAGSIRIRHTEFVGTITSVGTGYSLSTLSASNPGYDINPASSILFPWLSGIATNYERFRFNGLSIRLIPSQSATTAGRAYAAVDYDFDDPVPTTKAELMGNLDHAEAQVWDTIILRVDAQRMHADMPYKYVSLVSRGNYIEPRTAFCGFLLFAVDSPTSSIQYDLEVSYDVELVTPVVEDNGASSSEPGSMITDTRSFPTVGVSGGGYMGEILPLCSQLAATAVRYVRPGVQGVPELLLPGAISAAAAEQAIDLSLLPRNKGALSMVFSESRAATTPATMATSNSNNVRGAFYDALGAVVANLGPADTITSGGAAPSGGAVWSTSGGALRHTLKIALAALFTTYPTAKYFVPLLVSGASTGLAFRKGGVQYEL